MEDKDKTKDQLIIELKEIRRQVAKFKELEAEYRKAEELYRIITENTRDVITLITFDLNAINTYVSPSIKTLGYMPEELIGKSCFHILHPDDKKRLFSVLKKFIKAKEKNLLIGKESSFTEPFEYRVRDKSGNWLHAQSIGNIVGEHLLFVTRDITGQKRSEEKWQVEKAYLEQLFESAPEAVVLVDNDGRVMRINSEFTRMFGYISDEAIGQSIEELIAPGKYFKEAVSLTKQVAGGNRIGLETVRRHKDGTLVDVSLLGTSINVEGRQVALYAIYRDITERKKTEEALQRSEEKYRSLTNQLPVGVYRTTGKGEFSHVNPALAAILGYSSVEELMKVSPVNFYNAPGIRDKQLKQWEKRGRITSNEIEFLTKKGKKILVRDTGKVIHNKNGEIDYIDGIIEDITEKKKVEEELLKASKIESIGILAGGIAHDFNNMLTAIVGNISLAKEYINPEDNIYNILIKMEKASMQAKTLTQQLLTFARGGIPIKSTILLEGLLKDSTVFSLRGSNVRCEFSIPNDLWPVKVDAGQVAQVINNLIINADQAMSKGGIIEVSAENIWINANQTVPLKKGKYVKIIIKDHGIGIAAEHLNMIFDPFFSTKHKGSGLGLAIGYSIIKRHNGYISVESEIGVGTTFYIYLPASGKEPLEREWKKEVNLVAGKGKVLVMDDEEIVRDVACNMLKYIGYEVCLAKDGEEAIESYRKARESGTPFDVLILDLTVPGGMGGKETIDKLVEIEPDIKAIVSSGYSNDPIMANFKEHGFVEVVLKPYKIEELNVVLHKVMKNRRLDNI